MDFHLKIDDFHAQFAWFATLKWAEKTPAGQFEAQKRRSQPGFFLSPESRVSPESPESGGGGFLGFFFRFCKVYSYFVAFSLFLICWTVSRRFTLVVAGRRVLAR